MVIEKMSINLVNSVYVHCNCKGAYNGKGHNCGNGKCTGSEWAESYYTYEQTDCSNCFNNVNSVCEVATGKESILECEACNNAKKGSYPKYFHPMSEADWERYLAQM